GRTGSMNPYAVLEPVNVGGVVVRMATLHNEEDIKRKDIRIGDTVIVQRAGEVIPQVVGPVLSKRTGKERRFRPPKKCPACGTEVIRLEGEVMRYCPNRTCPAQASQLLAHFVSRGAMDIEGIGEQLSLTLLREGLVQDPADLFFLKKDDLLKLERMAEKSAQNVLDAIAASRERPLQRVLFALGIRHVGSETAALLARHFGSMDSLAKATEEELAAVPTIGPIVARSVHDYLQDKANRKLIEKLRRGGVRMEAEKAVVLTGRDWDVQVLKAGHHGSKGSTGMQWLAATTPEVVVASCGRRNTYGHPHPEVVLRVEGAGAEFFSTDRDGSVTFVLGEAGFVRATN
ncbi:MAG: hypothetical protein IIC73_00245, partial [Armatimonadetes bacterium]|nr:hypothetical protein [Armatimonadota bacterium]